MNIEYRNVFLIFYIFGNTNDKNVATNWRRGRRTTYCVCKGEVSQNVKVAEQLFDFSTQLFLYNMESSCS